MKRIHPKNEKIIIALLSILFAVVTSSDIGHINAILSNTMLVVLGILMLVILTFVMFLAGSIVIKSLFKVSVGLSLLIYLAQSYCAPEVARTTPGDAALKALIILGLSFVMYDFLTKIYKKFNEHSQKFKENGNWDWRGRTMIGLLLFFTGSLVLMVYQVLGPIILGLCVYK